MYIIGLMDKSGTSNVSRQVLKGCTAWRNCTGCYTNGDGVTYQEPSILVQDKHLGISIISILKDSNQECALWVDSKIEKAYLVYPDKIDYLGKFQFGALLPLGVIGYTYVSGVYYWVE